MRRLVLAAFLPLLLTGCSLGPKYNRPTLHPPTNYYTEQKSTEISTADLAWWDLFKDPVLQGLIHEALIKNYDVELAMSRVEQERNLLGVSKSQYWPQVGFDASVLGQGAHGIESHAYYPYAISTVWEIDLFGRIRKLNEAQRAVYFASEEARRDVRISVLSEVAQGYFQLRALDEQLVIAHRAVEGFEETLNLFQRKFQGGAASGLEVSRAQAALSNVEALIPDYERLIVAQENALDLLLGRNPGPVARGVTLAEQYDPPEVPAGIPASLLERRPDLRVAEQNLIEANAKIGVAKANFFPTISLTGMFGSVSPALSEFTAAGRAWSAAGTLMQPIFTAGRLKNEYRAAKDVYDEARVSFEKDVTQAFGEVSTSLSAHEQLAHALLKQQSCVDAYRESVRLSLIRYDSGLSSYFEVVDSQLQLYPAESTAVTYDLGRKLALVDLYRALGGGWKLDDSKWTSVNGTPSTTQTPNP